MAEPLRRTPEPIPYDVRRSPRARRIRVLVEADGRVEVVLPRRAAAHEAAAAVAELRPWIERRLREAAAVRERLAGTPGTVPYLGSELRLVAQAGRTRVHRRGDELLVPDGDPRAALERWFRRTAKTEIAPRLDHAAAVLERSYTHLTIRNQRTRWGSCSATGAMSFNWRLLLAPEPVLDYVVWHEACHLVVMDHSPRFWGLLERHLPGYRDPQRWLRRNGSGLVLSVSEHPRVGVVGHVEWVDFAVVERVPAPGTIVHAREHFAAAAGGGSVAAVQLRKLAGAATFLTVLGRDALGEAAYAELRDVHGIDVRMVWRDPPQRRGFTFLDDAGERTITVLGERLVPRADDPLPWEACAALDGIYFTAGDVGALRAARAARALVATTRARETIAAAGVELDALVASATDPGERIDAATLAPPPRYLVLTQGADGGSWKRADGVTGTWAATDLPGPPVDAFGCGDSFAAGLTYGLAASMGIEDALALAARCGAACLTGRGPYGRQLELN